MQRIKQIIRYHIDGLGSKRISALTKTSKNTVKLYVRRFHGLSMTWEALSELKEYEVHRLFGASQSNELIRQDPRFDRLQKLLPEVVKALRKRGMTIDLQWAKYKISETDYYQRTQFGQYLREYLKISNGTMHLEHKAGDKLFVDYTGNKLSIVDIDTGEITAVEVFVGILGCSQLTFVYACRTQSTEDFINCNRLCLEYLGGAPRAIVTDNLKAAVIKSSKYEPRLNQAFESFSEHYSTAVLPARAYKPKDKALVEGAVKLIYQRIFIPLDDQQFTSIQQLNEAILALCNVYNLMPLKGQESRRERFEEDERQTLTNLPVIPYEMRHSKTATVMKNGHVSLSIDRHFYSVPHTYIGKKVKVLFTSDQVEVYYKYELIAMHGRNYRKNRYTTLEEHMASKHKFMSDWNPDFFVNKGKALSETIGLYMEKVMEHKPYPEQGFKACNGILNLSFKVGVDRLSKACQRATEYGTFNYGVIQDILTKKLDQIDPATEKPPEDKHTPEHNNIRGNKHYK